MIYREEVFLQCLIAASNMYDGDQEGLVEYAEDLAKKFDEKFN